MRTEAIATTLLVAGAVAAGCRTPVTCKDGDLYEPNSMTCLPPCTELGAGLPCWSDGGIYLDGIGRDGAVGDAGDLVDSALDTQHARPDAIDVDTASPPPLCDGGGYFCGGECVDTNRDPRHCGSCSRECSTSVTNAVASCSAGSCSFQCVANYERSGDACVVSAPRLIAPMSGATVNTRSPTLTIDLGTAEEAQITVCRDRAMRLMCTTADGVRVGTIAVESLIGGPISSGWWFWRASTVVGGRVGIPGPVWQFRVSENDSSSRTSWIRESDFNGDGLADFAVGAPGADEGRGIVNVYLGARTGVGSDRSTVLRGTRERGGYGASLGRIGDVNGDGFADLAIGSSWAGRTDFPGRGSVSVHLGGPTGVSETSSFELVGIPTEQQFGRSIVGGDVNNDGFVDLIVGTQNAVHVYHGSVAGIHTSPTQRLNSVCCGEMGASLAIADVNGDGFLDLAVGSPRRHYGALLNAGGVDVFLGGRVGIHSTPVRSLEPVPGGFFGGAVSFGDLNGDGLADLVVGAPLHSNGGSQRGSAHVYLGSETGTLPAAAQVLSGRMALDSFGSSVSALGDYNRDGVDDLLIVAGSGIVAGMAAGYVQHFAGIRGSGTLAAPSTFQDVPSSTISACSSVGDFDGDGFDDLALGSPALASGVATAGRWVFVPGSPTGPNFNAAISIDGPSRGSEFGRLLR